jgi:repressor LexA
MKELSPQQQRVYDCILQYKLSKGICPSIEDIAAELELSNSTVATYVENLRQKGCITSEYGIPRSLQVVTEEG